MFQFSVRLLSIFAVTFAACDSSPSSDQPDASVTPDAATPTFLAPSAYADLFAIDAQFPFGVVSRHAANSDIAGSHWGRDGGPIVTLGVYGATGRPAVVKWSLPADPIGAATSTPVTFVAAGLPATFFYGADGMVDLPFGPSSLLDYTGSGAPYTGEAFLYSAAYDQVASRAYANGFYSGAGVSDGTKNVVIYSGLSTLTAAKTTTTDNGLYAAPVCNGKFLDAGCAASAKVAAWQGSSGPVVTDANGNVFVGASLSSGTTSDAVLAITKAQALAAVATTPARLADVDSGGTSSIAAVAPTATALGWVLGIGFNIASGVYAAPYTDTLAKGTSTIAKAIAPTATVNAISMFTDETGHLWLAVTTDNSGFYLGLERTE